MSNCQTMPAISRWKQMQCQIKVVKCNVGGHFENMAAIFEFDGILGGQHFLLDKKGKLYVHTKFHACITICTILVLTRSTNRAKSCCKIDFGTMIMHLFRSAVLYYDAKARPLRLAVRIIQTVTTDLGTECIVPGKVNRIIDEHQGFMGPVKKISEETQCASGEYLSGCKS